MSFGEHFENAVIGFVNKIDAIIKRNHDWHEESISLGLISDDEKLRTLKRDLYCEVRLSNPNQQKIINLTQTIQTLEEIKHAEEARKFERLKHSYTFPVQLEVFTNTTFFLAIAVVMISYLGSFTCGNSRSQFCSNARVIPSQVDQFFKD
ncbi:hypothetical protein AB0756_39545 [Tolypothrix campylonemoides VB511288_2]|uniref:SMODS and SLOG-associating 2TM effector domain-containing protein n=2 Tax=Nostocales TaxID=1161 RepID=A0ABW8WK22_9CYAN